MNMTEEDRIKKAHIMMMKHPETAFYSGVMMMGTSEVVDQTITAYTDGVNKRYGRAFLQAVCKEQAEVNGLVLHENLHIALRHMLHNRDLFEANAKRANIAADLVVNDIIMNLKDKTLCKLPAGGCYDPKYHNMNMREIYRLLEDEEGGGGRDGEPQKKKGGESGGQGDGQDSGSGGGEYQFDEHDFRGQDGAGDPLERAKEIDQRIDRALREGALLAGRLGIDLPRAITEILEPQVDWRRELSEFVTASCKGKDEYTWRKFNRRLLPNDIFMPSVENETISEIVVAIDTSGSIGQAQINEFATELVSIAEAVQPDLIRVLWWDTMVHGEQIFKDNFGQIASMLKPKGGGGTKVSCVGEYLNKKKVNADCCLVFTDGYVENDVKWDVPYPTLWLVTENKSWVVPTGKKVMFD